MKRQQRGCFDLQRNPSKPFLYLLTPEPARPTILKFYHSLSAMPVVSKPGQFDPGEIVYARFFGSKAFIVKGIATAIDAPFLHYFCQLKSDIYLIPMIHLSRRDLVPLVGNGNHR